VEDLLSSRGAFKDESCGKDVFSGGAFKGKSCVACVGIQPENYTQESWT